MAEERSRYVLAGTTKRLFMLFYKWATLSQTSRSGFTHVLMFALQSNALWRNNAAYDRIG